MGPISEHLARLRQDYQMNALDEQELDDNPVVFFKKWFEQAQAAALPEPNAMALSTVDQSNQPQSRIVLLKGLEQEGFVFFTNYLSQKGVALESNPKACLLFFWQGLERQVRIEGVIEKTSSEYSDTYFNMRPLESRIGAIASPQSQQIENRNWLESRVLTLQQNLKKVQPERPEHWGGYVLHPHRIEFWQGRSNRLHDRIQYSLDSQKNWTKQRIAP